ncbi:hypothetical protein HOL63_00420 [Candidatus Peregrinibacteria bacterium]|jgi:hypothetical protein|nr:hypothetical protein [Candidatus Peregrinibacteria bacterium]MBT5468392.1 hypothetical protein [Candidatus Peregrinibacteria bacterium]MBT7337483.1 hypothetical protein [Candidatus Peregrinibacteria bacterium]
MQKQKLIEELTLLTGRSAILTPHHKKAILKALPTMKQEKILELQEILGEERSVIAVFAEQTISQAIQHGDTKIFKKMDSLLVKTNKKLLKTDEVTSTSIEQGQLEHFFDDITT